MNILFLMINMPDSEGSGMYKDLACEFHRYGHHVTVITSARDRGRTVLHQEGNLEVLRVKTNPVVGVKSLIKKGYGFIRMPQKFLNAFKKCLNDREFDWVFMPTPPITLIDLVAYVKKKTNARFYLILRDIHPQSAASIGLIKSRLVYNYFARKALKSMNASDFIGCMSKGNIEFVLSTYPHLDRSKLGLLLNWQKESIVISKKIDLRKKYGLSNKFVVLFGGNIGLVQRIENIVSLASHYILNKDIVFLVIGKGVKKKQLMNISRKEGLDNIRFFDFMPRGDYLDFIKTVDLGLISINENYTVPTCPSKAVSYMSMGIPIMAVLNPDNDYGEMIEETGAGLYTIGGDSGRMFDVFDTIYNDKELRIEMGKNGIKYFQEKLTVSKAYLQIEKQMNSFKN